MAQSSQDSKGNKPKHGRVEDYNVNTLKLITIKSGRYSNSGVDAFISKSEQKRA